MDWSLYLEREEDVRWQGRPAPRCYTFRKWKHSIFGLALLLLSLFWWGLGMRLTAGELRNWLPLPFALAGAYLSFGHLLWSRLQWERVFYAITDRRIIVHKILPTRVLFCPLAEVTRFDLYPVGENLGTIKITAEGRKSPLTLECIEYPEVPASMLRRAIDPHAL